IAINLSGDKPSISFPGGGGEGGKGGLPKFPGGGEGGKGGLPKFPGGGPPKFPGSSGEEGSPGLPGPSGMVDAAKSGTLHGTITLYGTLTYNKEEGAIYLLDLKVDELKIEDLPEQFIKPISKVVEEKLNEKMSEKPVKTFANDLKDSATKAVFQSIEAKGGSIVVTFGI
ncbi:MAG: DUF1439 domain-containing protein, partial [Planctomycetales bacterium]